MHNFNILFLRDLYNSLKLFARINVVIEFLLQHSENFYYNKVQETHHEMR